MSPGQKKLNEAARALSAAYQVREATRKAMANVRMSGLADAVASSRMAIAEFEKAVRDVVTAEAVLLISAPEGAVQANWKPRGGMTE